ncbi:helix-turn-helix transcriptional regulator [Burkholderia ubonensis]|uniref:S24 family peptidase n=1 Tax=Burkholderia ubonensis TaxID=101571 RepID=UPI0012F85E28|nr:helix-turn-helix transcriptional regulator [Burkholderia ubonensis]
MVTWKNRGERILTQVGEKFPRFTVLDNGGIEVYFPDGKAVTVHPPGSPLAERGAETSDVQTSFTLFLSRLYAASGTDTLPTLYAWGESNGFSRQSLYNMISQNRVPGLETLRRFRKATGRPIDWLLGEDVLNPVAQDVDSTTTPAQDTPDHLTDEFVLIPRYDVRASTGAGNWHDNGEQAQYCMAFRRHWVENYLHAKKDDLSVVRVHGDSMAPLLQDGDNILVNHAVNSPQDGVYVIRIDGQVLVKQTQVLTGKKLRIVSVNTTYESYTVDLAEDNQTDFEVIGKVVWFGRQI